MGAGMKFSTIYLVLCFALAPFAARAMVQHRDVLHQMQRHAIPMIVAASVPAVMLENDVNSPTCNRGVQSGLYRQQLIEPD
jgi:hypothetical protein